METWQELIKKINENTAAQKEQTERWRLELELPEREPTELDLLLQKWEQATEVPLSAAPEREAPLSPEPEEKESFTEPDEVEPWPSPEPRATVKGEEVSNPPPSQPQA
ncbi:UNVERIFIED_CONTAM: hypothetical protein FKN15_067224 [Acipenser sinensis]